MTKKAYLNIQTTFVNTRIAPCGVVVNCAIHSSPAYQLTAHSREGIWSTITEVEAASFQEAHDIILAFVKEIKTLKPLLLWLDPSQEMHQVRYHVHQFNIRD